MQSTHLWPGFGLSTGHFICNWRTLVCILTWFLMPVEKHHKVTLPGSMCWPEGKQVSQYWAVEWNSTPSSSFGINRSDVCDPKLIQHQYLTSQRLLRLNAIKSSLQCSNLNGCILYTEWFFCFHTIEFLIFKIIHGFVCFLLVWEVHFIWIVSGCFVGMLLF